MLFFAIYDCKLNILGFELGFWLSIFHYFLVFYRQNNRKLTQEFTNENNCFNLQPYYMLKEGKNIDFQVKKKKKKDPTLLS